MRDGYLLLCRVFVQLSRVSLARQNKVEANTSNNGFFVADCTATSAQESTTSVFVVLASLGARSRPGDPGLTKKPSA